MAIPFKAFTVGLASACLKATCQLRKAVGGPPGRVGVYGGQTDVASESEHFATVDGAGFKHVHKDHLGSTRLVTSATGSVVSQHNYWPFGEEMTVTSSPERMRFAGHERDTLSSLDSMHARFYAPWGGRFLSVDPGRDDDFHKPQSFNLYAYVRNNPVNAVDQSGRAAVAAIPAWYVGAALAGATSAWLAAPSATHPGKTNAQVIGDTLSSLAQAFIRRWQGPADQGRIRDRDLTRRDKAMYKAAKQGGSRLPKSERPGGGDPLPPGARGPHRPIGEKPWLQNAPDERDFTKPLGPLGAEGARQAIEHALEERRRGQELKGPAVNVTSTADPSTGQEPQEQKP
ncbi:MAG: RHS repeat-associated core domain-containing protein [Candidatus Hadarchaeum sp.]